MIAISILLVEILHLLILNQLVFTAWPEMLSYSYLISRDFVPYKDFIFPYPPGLPLILLTVFNNFGFSVFVLKIFAWILIILTDITIFLILKKISKNNLISIIFLFFYIFLQSFLDGHMLWFDFAGVLPLLLGFYFCFIWQNKQNLKYLFLISLFLSIAVMIKQVNVIYFLVFGLLYFFQRKKIILKEIIYLIFGSLIVFIPFLFYIFNINAVSEFFNWVILYPITKWSKFPGYVNFDISKRQLITIFLLFSPLTCLIIYWKKIINDRIFIMISLFFVTSVITIYPRFSFFHLQPALAFLIILFVKIYVEIYQKQKPLFLLFILMVITMILFINFKSVSGNRIRFYEQQDLNLTNIIKKKIKNNENVFLLGINSSEYVYANRIPPKNWSDNFGWYLEIPGIQQWVIEGLRSETPKIIFWKMPLMGNWYDLGVYQPEEIADYIRRNYHETGMIESSIEIWEKN